MTETRVQLLINIDVPDLESASRFYVSALGLRVGRRLEGSVELLGAAVPVYLLESREGSLPFPAAKSPRDYGRHWTPVHLDVVVADLDRAGARAAAHGARSEGGTTEFAWGRMALFSDPFGNGFCLIEFHGRGYDEIAIE